MIENPGQEIDQIFIEPPEATVLTDVDSADEDTGGLIENLTGRQLRAGAEVNFADKSTEGITANDDCDDNVESHSTSIDNDQSDTDVADQSTFAPPSRQCKRTYTSMNEARNIGLRQHLISRKNVQSSPLSKENSQRRPLSQRRSGLKMIYQLQTPYFQRQISPQSGPCHQWNFLN